jgi:hypothetical protein
MRRRAALCKPSDGLEPSTPSLPCVRRWGLDGTMGVAEPTCDHVRLRDSPRFPGSPHQRSPIPTHLVRQSGRRRRQDTPVQLGGRHGTPGESPGPRSRRPSSNRSRTGARGMSSPGGGSPARRRRNSATSTTSTGSAKVAASVVYASHPQRPTARPTSAATRALHPALPPPKVPR